MKNGDRYLVALTPSIVLLLFKLIYPWGNVVVLDRIHVFNIVNLRDA